jgi:hypothetical protein
MTEEFHEVCSIRLPQVTHAYERNFLKCADAVLKDKDLAEVFFLATEGLHVDLPTPKALRARLQILVDRFVCG